MLKQTLPLFLVALLLMGCAVVPSGEPDSLPTELQVTQATAPSTTPATTEPITETTVPETEPITETTVPETEPLAPVLHSGIREDGSFDSGTLFIGDSQTYLFISDYLIRHELIGDARYAAQCGSQLTVFWDEDTRLTEDKSVYCIFSPEFEGMSFREAAAHGGAEVTAIYLMWGSNYTPDATAQSYIDIVQSLLELCPNATVHLQTIPQGDVAYVTVNKRITGAWEYFQSIGEPRVTLVDTFGGIGTSIGSDRVHVTPLGREKWYATLVSHAQALGLEQ